MGTANQYTAFQSLHVATLPHVPSLSVTPRPLSRGHIVGFAVVQILRRDGRNQGVRWEHTTPAHIKSTTTHRDPCIWVVQPSLPTCEIQ